MPRHLPASFRTLAAAVMAWAFAVAAPAIAQQEFKLDESDRWREMDAPPPGSPAAVLRMARLALATGEAKRAKALADAWLERFGLDPLRPEALLIRGDAKDALGDEYEALFDYEDIARRYPYSAAFVPALEREYGIAQRYVAGLRRKFWGTIRVVNADDDAQEILIRIQERLPGSALAEKAGMALADFYYERRDMELAADAYDLFVQNYPRSRFVDKARLRLIAAYCSGYKGPQFDARGLGEAAVKLRELQATEPLLARQIGAEAILLRVYESEADKRLTTANWYWTTGDPISAEREIRALVKKYPRSVATLQALRVIDDVLARLPDVVRRSAPDYAGIRAELMAASGRAQVDGPMPVERIEETSISEVGPVEVPPEPGPSATPEPTPPTAPSPQPGATP